MLSNSGLGIARSTNDFALSMQGNWRWLFIQHSTVIIISMTAAKMTCSLWEHFDINNFKRGEICLILCMYVRRKGIYSTGSVGVSIKWFCFHDTQESHFEKKNHTLIIYIGQHYANHPIWYISILTSIIEIKDDWTWNTSRPLQKSIWMIFFPIPALY